MNARQRVEAWNREHPVGTVVVLVRDSGEAQTTRTSSEAMVSSSGHPVIWLGGVSGYYLLSRVHPVDVGAVLRFVGEVVP